MSDAGRAGSSAPVAARPSRRDEPYPVPLPERAARRRRRPRPERARLDPARARFPDDRTASRTRSSATATLLHRYHFARARGMTDAEFVALVARPRRRGRRRRRARLRGHAVRAAAPSSPTGSASGRRRRLGQGRDAATSSGSHKARHLIGVLLQLEVAERLGLADAAARARPGDRELRQRRPGGRGASRAAGGGRCGCSSRPTPTRPSSTGSSELGADVAVCRAQRGRRRAIRRTTALRAGGRSAGALPFTCQGNRQRPRRSKAARRSATRWRASCAAGTRSTASSSRSAAARSRAPASRRCARRATLGALDQRCPRLDTRADRGRLARSGARSTTRSSAARRRPMRSRTRPRTAREFMWPWEDEPHSVAARHPRRRDLRLARRRRGMLETGGRPSSSTEETLAEATRARARAPPASPSTPPGTSGLAGLLALRAPGRASRRRRAGRRAVHRRQTQSHRKEREMRSFLGRDILSLKDFERDEFPARLRGLRRARADRREPAEQRPARGARRC